MIKEYPIFTVENFDEMFKKHIRNKKDYGLIFLGRKPRNEKEFSKLTKATLGVELHLIRAHESFYEIEESYNSYKDLPLVKLWNQKTREEYFGAMIAIHTTFGKLSTGGTARSQYGSFNVVSYRDKLRLRNFWNS